MIKKKIQHTKFIVEEGDVLKDNSDLLINWTTGDLASGDDLFVKIHKEGGSIIYRECQKALMGATQVPVNETTKVPNPTLNPLSVGKVVITNSGMLPVGKLLHVVIPNYRNKEEQVHKDTLILESYKAIFLYLDLFNKEKYPIRKITFSPIPGKLFGNYSEKTIKNFISYIIKNSISLNLRQVKIICDKNNYTDYSKEFIKQTCSFWDKLLNLKFRGF